MGEVSFYQLSRDAVERVVPLLAAKVLEGGERLLVVSGNAAQRAELSEALWAREGAFLANGEASAPHAERQPVLLVETCEAANGARTAILADGEWREEAAGLDRAMLLFGPEHTAAARELWAELSGAGHAPRIFKQERDGRWHEGR